MVRLGRLGRLGPGHVKCYKRITVYVNYRNLYRKIYVYI